MKIAIIGLGHIGGSFALELRNQIPKCQIMGVDSNPSHADKAMEMGLVDEMVSLENGVEKADLILLATPVNAMIELLPFLLSQITSQVIMDVGSTKSELLSLIKVHPKRGRFVATHPMAGQENSGPEAAVENLFANKCTVICDHEDSDPDALGVVEDIYKSLNMRIVYLDSVSHDVHAAYVSHISHISSFALALTVLAKEKDEERIFELASGGFGSTVRLAKSSPDMWIPIFEQNRDNVLDVLDEHINTLAQFRSLLIKKDFKKFHKLIEQANHIRKILK